MKLDRFYVNIAFLAALATSSFLVAPAAQAQSVGQCQQIVDMGPALVRPGAYATCVDILGANEPEATRAPVVPVATPAPGVQPAPLLETTVTAGNGGLRLSAELCAELSGSGGNTCTLAQGTLTPGGSVLLQRADGSLVRVSLGGNDALVEAEVLGGNLISAQALPAAGGIAQAGVGQPDAVASVGIGREGSIADVSIGGLSIELGL